MLQFADPFDLVLQDFNELHRFDADRAAFS
jgi:hypothetical protein